MNYFTRVFDPRTSRRSSNSSSCAVLGVRGAMTSTSPQQEWCMPRGPFSLRIDLNIWRQRERCIDTLRVVKCWLLSMEYVFCTVGDFTEDRWKTCYYPKTIVMIIAALHDRSNMTNQSWKPAATNFLCMHRRTPPIARRWRKSSDGFSPSYSSLSFTCS